MQVIGSNPGYTGEAGVHTIDVWFSEASRRWIVQRLDERGDPVGHSHTCRTEGEAKACLADWLRRHPETYLTTPRSSRQAKETSQTVARRIAPAQE